MFNIDTLPAGTIVTQNDDGRVEALLPDGTFCIYTLVMDGGHITVLKTCVSKDCKIVVETRKDGDVPLS